MAVGHVVADRFELELVAGAGAMGTVYRARDRHSGELVAVKILHGQGSGGAAERFAREARLLAELRHPGIVRYVAHGDAGDLGAYIAMEWLEGQDLATRLAHDGLEAADALELAARVADALGAAHARGVVHRDIKPQNVFLPAGRVDRAKVLDFGIARAKETVHARTRTGALLGTPGYMAPEQARASGDIGPPADVFALGAVLFECLTGQPAFSGAHMMAMLAKVLFEEAPRASDLRAGIPPEVDALLRAMLAKDPAARPPHGAAAAAALRALGHVTGAAPSAKTSPLALTAVEHRLVSVVLIGTQLATDAADTVAVAADGPTVTQPFAELSAALRDAVEARGGHVEPLADGSIVATLYGTAVGTGAVTDQVVRAARIALALRELVPDLPIALATGRARACDGVPLGDVVDRAARMLAVSAPAASGAGPVLMDSLSAGLLGTRFDTEETGGVFALGAERATSGLGARPLLGRTTPLVGRDRELLTIEATLAHCLSERVARPVLVIGASGEGKSRLADEACARSLLAHAGLRIWRARSDPMRHNARFAMLGQLARDALGIDVSAPLDERRATILSALERNGHRDPDDAVRTGVFLGELAGAPFEDDASLQLRAARSDPALMGDQLRRAWNDWLTTALENAPVLIILDDLQWADEPSLDALGDSLRRHEEAPWMLLALGRPELHDRFPGLWATRATTELRLGPLSPRASEKLVRHALAQAATDDVVRRIVSRAAGNALFLEELVRSVAEGRGDALPETVLAMVQARLEALDPEARRFLRAASVFGLEFRTSGVVALLGGTDRAALAVDWLEVLVSDELVAPVSGRAHTDAHEFRSAPAREAAYAMLSEADRHLGHRLAAQWLEAEGERDAVVLAEHLVSAAEPARAVAHYTRAAEQALEANHFDAVVELTVRARAAGARGESLGRLLLASAEAQNWRGSAERALPCGLEALELLPERSQTWIAAATEVAAASTTLSRLALALDVVRQLLSITADDTTAPALVTALSRTATRLLAAAEYSLAEEVRVHVDAIERKTGGLPPAAEAWLWFARAGYAMHGGDPGGFLVCLERSASLFEQTGNARVACMQWVNLGFACSEMGLYERAMQVERRALAVAEQLGLARVATAARQNLGYAIARSAMADALDLSAEQATTRHALEEALALLRASSHEFVAQGDGRLAGGGETYCAMVLRELGRLDEAERDATSAITRLDVAPALAACAHAELSMILLARGEAQAALAAAVRATTLRESLGKIEAGEAGVRLAHAEALDRTGAHAEARAALALARDRLHEQARAASDPAIRKSFLERIPENVRTLALARAWGL